jgi:rhodanese-related sulfurtransferase
MHPSRPRRAPCWQGAFRDQRATGARAHAPDAADTDQEAAVKNFLELIRNCLTEVRELMPWDLVERLEANPDLLIVDVREPAEFEAMHIAGSLNVPRGILESACEWDYEETEPELVRAREREVVLVCRSGHRSVLAAHSLQVLGYTKVASLKTGLRGWKDYEQPLVDGSGDDVDLDDADLYFTPRLREDQRRPAAA